MAETTIWRGNPSQWKNFGGFVFAAIIAIAITVASIFAARSASAESRRLGPFILIFLLLPIFMALTRYLQTKNRIYELTTERLKTSEGVLNRVTDTLELYRVKDLETHASLFVSSRRNRECPTRKHFGRFLARRFDLRNSIVSWVAG